MNILITGSNGFLCQKLILNLLTESHIIIGIDKNKNILKKNKNFIFFKCNISNKSKLFKIFNSLNKKIDLIIHAAAFQPLSQEQDLEKMINVNTVGSTNILSMCKLFNIKNLIYTSSFSIYGNQKKLPIREDAKKIPQNFYGLSKLLSEKQIKLFSDKYELNYIILRFDGIYGFNQNLPGFVKMCYENMIQNKNIELFNLGKQIRDQVYVDDALNSIMLSIKKIKKIKKNIFNIGGGEPISNYLLAKIILNNLKSESMIQKIKSKNPNISNSFLNITKAKKILGYNPKSVNQNIYNYILETKKNGK